MRAIDLDPAGERHGGLPTWPWRPAEMATRRQLRAMGLRPGGQQIAAQVVCRRGARRAYLYRVDEALPVRPMTESRQRSLAAAMRARSTCPLCRITYAYCLPLRTLGCCLPCSELTAEERDRLATLTQSQT
ncbi:RRQRL motif-containing zinc-binding protein [Kitasatospora purpeofusca]|uniref:RRQRL motif-containing zinc-binding protein n=1 Tax=Kitasatospora purpeofusca TaxID=67352 RepID=UPI0037F58760